MALSAVAVPITAGAEAYVNKSLIYVDNSDFTEVSSGVAGLPVTVNGQPWNRKGSAANMSETYMSEDGRNYCHIISDGIKGSTGVAGEGSYYFYNKNEKTGMSESGYVKFDIRMNEGSAPMELNMGHFTDPTKGTAPAAAQLVIDPGLGSIVATTSGGKKVDVFSSLAADKWYTVEIELNVKPLEEYDVTVYDETGKEVGSAKELAFIDKDIEMVQTTAFSYVRKNPLTLSFDLTNVTIARMNKESVEATQKASAAEATPTPTPEPSATPTPTASPDASMTPAPATPTPAPVKVDFPDVSTHWAKAQIEEMASAGVINGMDDGTFRPDAQITRGQFVKLIVAALGLDASAAYTGSATDVAGHWAASYVQAADTLHLIDSAMMADGQLKLDQNITREEMASIIARAAQSKKLTIGASADAANFTDAASIAAWAKSDVIFAAKLGIITGYEDGTFLPQNLSTRAESAVMMSRLFARIKAEG